MKIKVYAIGKIKDFYKEGVDEYVKRITPYCNIEIIEFKDEPLPNNPNDGEIKKAKDIEGERVLKTIGCKEFLIGLDLDKKQLESPEFARFLEKKFQIYSGSISFVIGGSYGLSDELKKRCNEFISLSKFTFLHQMSRLILLEQIYRSFKILNNETYHKWEEKSLSNLN